MTHPDDHPNAFKLALFIGSWTGHGQIFANPWSPAASCEGQWQFEFDRSGHHLIHDYHETRSNGDLFTGHGVFNVDKDTKNILWFWFDSYGFPPLDPAKGQWENETLTLIKHTARGVGRSSFRFSHGSFAYLVEAQVNGAEGFSPVMKGEFEKVRTAVRSKWYE